MIPGRDEDALDDSSGDVADGQEFVLSPHDRVEHDGRSDVREDEKEVQEGSEVDLAVLPATRDVAGRIVENRLEESQRCDRLTNRVRQGSYKPVGPLGLMRASLQP